MDGCMDGVMDGCMYGLIHVWMDGVFTKHTHVVSQNSPTRQKKGKRAYRIEKKKCHDHCVFQPSSLLMKRFNILGPTHTHIYRPPNQHHRHRCQHRRQHRQRRPSPRLLLRL